MTPGQPAPSEAASETAALLLAIFAESYRQEVGAEEDVHRTLPFFGTALGIVIGALAYAAGRLPLWSAAAAEGSGAAFILSAVLLGLAVFEAGCVLVWLSRAIARRNYQRVGPETALRQRVADLQAYYDGQGLAPDRQDDALARDMRQVLLDSYTAVSAVNRDLNQMRYRFRALAASHLVRSLIWALSATSVIFMADKLGYLPRVIPVKTATATKAPAPQALDRQPPPPPVPIRKPSGTVTYTVSKGADVWPERR